MAERHRIIGPVAVLILLAAISAISWCGAAPASAATPISVTTTADELNTDGDCSLREAVQAVNTATAVDACPAGSNHIVLPTGRFSVASALVVRAPMVVTGGGRLTDNTGIVSSIDGFGSGPEPVAPHVFQVAAGGALTLERLSIQTAATQMISADAGAGTLTLSGIDTYDGGYGSPAFVTVDSPVVVTGVAFQNYYSTVGSTDRGSITVSESTASSPAACAFCAGSGSITVQHSATTNLRTSTGPITVRRSFVGSSGSNGGPVHPSIWSDSGPITVDSSSVSYAVAGVLTGGGTSIVRSSTLRPLTSGPAIQLSGTASLTATSSILTCSSTTGVHSGGHNITDGSWRVHRHR